MFIEMGLCGANVEPFGAKVRLYGVSRRYLGVENILGPSWDYVRRLC